MTHLRICIVAGLLLMPLLASAQGLADVARAEQARRRAAPKATKTYTNDDLGPDKGAPRPAVPSSDVPAPPAAATTSTEGAAASETPAATAAAPSSEPKRDEDYWRGRITAVREQLQRNKLFAEALQSRINALATDFVNRDDPAQRALIGEDRQAALAELARVQNETLDLNKRIADIEDEARRAGVPPGWLR